MANNYDSNYFNNSGNSDNSNDSGNRWLPSFLGGLDRALERQDSRNAGMLDRALERHSRCLWDSNAYKVFCIIVALLVGFGLFWVFTHVEDFLIKDVVSGNTASVKADVNKLIVAGLTPIGVFLGLAGIGMSRKQH
jgi:hypothetical protein